MIVTLIGKNVLYKTKLPKVAMGNYWISDENDKKLINIEGDGRSWKVVGNNNVKIIKPKAITSLDVSEISQEPQNLMEEIIFTRIDIFISINSTRSNNSNRWFLIFHNVNLSTRSLAS